MGAGVCWHTCGALFSCNSFLVLISLSFFLPFNSTRRVLALRQDDASNAVGDVPSSSNEPRTPALREDVLCSLAVIS